MRLIDLNLLLYAVNRDSTLHVAARSWLESALNDDQPVAFTWIVLLGFVRLTTNRNVLSRPLSTERALAVVDGWLDRPNVRIVTPGDRHWQTLRRLLAQCGGAGNLTTDAHLAAMAIDNGAELCSTDGDFSRFPGLRWINPLQ